MRLAVPPRPIRPYGMVLNNVQGQHYLYHLQSVMASEDTNLRPQGL